MNTTARTGFPFHPSGGYPRDTGSGTCRLARAGVAYKRDAANRHGEGTRARQKHTGAASLRRWKKYATSLLGARKRPQPGRHGEVNQPRGSPQERFRHQLGPPTSGALVPSLFAERTALCVRLRHQRSASAAAHHSSRRRFLLPKLLGLMGAGSTIYWVSTDCKPLCDGMHRRPKNRRSTARFRSASTAHGWAYAPASCCRPD